MVKDSGTAKSIGNQKEDDVQGADNGLYGYLRTEVKVSKDEAKYREQHNDEDIQQGSSSEQSCDKCKFNLPADKSVVG